MSNKINFYRCMIAVVAFFLVLGAGGGAAWAKKEKKIKGTAQKTTQQAAAMAATSPGGPVAGVPAAATTAGPDIAQIQEQLRNIIQIHESLQSQGIGQVHEIQRIRDQTQAHQALLQELAPLREAGGTKIPKTPTVDELIQIQKLRMIQQEASRNRAALEQFRKTAEEKGAGATLAQKSEKQEEEKKSEKKPTAKKSKQKK